MKKQQCYYARCKALYGTPQEARDIETIRKMGYEPAVFDRNIVDALKERAQDVMEMYFLPLVSTCPVLFFRSLPDGSIPAGVAKEVAHAQSKGIIVLELPSSVQRRSLSVELTREYLREVGER